MMFCDAMFVSLRMRQQKLDIPWESMQAKCARLVGMTLVLGKKEEKVFQSWMQGNITKKRITKMKYAAPLIIKQKLNWLQKIFISEKFEVCSKHPDYTYGWCGECSREFQREQQELSDRRQIDIIKQALKEAKTEGII